MTDSPQVKVNWFDGKEMAYAFFRSRFFRIRRTGYVRYLNLLGDLVALPFAIVNLMVAAPIFAACFVVWKVSRVLRRPDGAEAESLTQYAKKVQWLLSLVPTYLVMKGINDWRNHPRRRKFFDNRPPILYLRPFKMDNRKAVTPNDAPLMLEELIRNTTRALGPLIALGSEGYAGASKAERIEVPDETWKGEAARLMHTSGHVVLVPEDTEGTLWEIGKILEDASLLKKTIFLNTAAAGRDHPYWARSRTIYSDDDGKVFIETLMRITQSEIVTQIPSEQIAGAAIINGELNLFCAERLFDAGIWSALPGLVIYIKSKGPLRSNLTRDVAS